MTLNQLLEELKEESWGYLGDTVCQGSNNYENFAGASGAVRNSSSTNTTRCGLAVSYEGKEVAVIFEKRCDTPEHIRVLPSDSPKSTIFIEWQNNYAGLTSKEKKAVDEIIKEKVRKRFMDKGAKYVTEEGFRIVYSL